MGGAQPGVLRRLLQFGRSSPRRAVAIGFDHGHHLGRFDPLGDGVNIMRQRRVIDGHPAFRF